MQIVKMNARVLWVDVKTGIVEVKAATNSISYNIVNVMTPALMLTVKMYCKTGEKFSIMRPWKWAKTID